MTFSYEYIALGCVALLVCFGVFLFIRHARRVEVLKYEFMTIAAHKLRTPLTSIKWELSALFARLDLDTQTVEGLKRIDTASNQLLELTNVLMDSAQTRRGLYQYQREQIDLGRLATEALGRLDARIAAKNISVVTQLAPGLPVVYGDRARIAAVVDVLVENAVQYNRQGGSIRISVTAAKRAVKFSVSDTGIGVHAPDIPRLFTPFFRSERAKRADTEGVGVGLSVVKDVVTRHGGTVGVESPGEERGATFWFILPV